MAPPGYWHSSASVYIRVVALSIAFYDYILTLPAEWRFYRGQRSWRLSPGCILFIAIRYTSIFALVTSAVGFFGHFFTQELCAKYYMIPPVLKVAQTMVSQLILGIRTINVSRRAPWVVLTIAVAFTLASTAEGVLNLSNRVPLQGLRGNCTAGNTPPRLTVWLFYIFAMVYDLLTLCISSVYLIEVSPNSGKIGRLVKIMLADGLIYFVALTGVNILNLILYRSTDEMDQTSGVTLGYASTWIMSQRILIHLRDAAEAHNRTQVIVSRQLPSAHSISHAMRSQFESKDARTPLSTGFDLHVNGWSMTSSCPRYSETTAPTTDAKTSASGGRMYSYSGDRERRQSEGAAAAESELESEVQVQVQIEETVTVEYDPEALVRESYRMPRVLWGDRWSRGTARGSGHATDGRGERGGAEERDARQSQSRSRWSEVGAASRIPSLLLAHIVIDHTVRLVAFSVLAILATLALPFKSRHVRSCTWLPLVLPAYKAYVEQIGSTPTRSPTHSTPLIHLSHHRDHSPSRSRPACQPAQQTFPLYKQALSVHHNTALSGSPAITLLPSLPQAFIWPRTNCPRSCTICSIYSILYCMLVPPHTLDA